MSDPTSFVLAYSPELRETDFRSRENHKWLMQLHRVQQGRCFYCRMWISLRLRDSRDPNSATVDHFIPLALGGRDTIANVVLACPRCNKKKGDSPPTLKRILKWNELSKVWTHIQPLTLDRHVREKKRCSVCPNYIPMERWLESVKTDAETRTCSKECSSLERRTRKKQYRADRAAAAGIDLDGGAATAEETDVRKMAVCATQEPGREEVKTLMSRFEVPDDYARNIREAEASTRLEGIDTNGNVLLTQPRHECRRIMELLLRKFIAESFWEGFLGAGLFVRSELPGQSQDTPGLRRYVLIQRVGALINLAAVLFCFFVLKRSGHKLGSYSLMGFALLWLVAGFLHSRNRRSRG